MKHYFGMAGIPLILGFAFMVISTAIAMELVKNNQNPQNRAALVSNCLLENQSGCFENPCCSGYTCDRNVCISSTKPAIPCTDLANYYQQYCKNLNNSANKKIYQVPCHDTLTILNTHCPSVTSIPTPTSSTGTPATSCRPQEIKNVGKFIFICQNNRWVVQPQATPTRPREIYPTIYQ